MKDLKYYKDNCEEDYIKTPISVLRYITELEKKNKAEQLNTPIISNSATVKRNGDFRDDNNRESQSEYYGRK